MGQSYDYKFNMQIGKGKIVKDIWMSATDINDLKHTIITMQDFKY